MNSSNALGRAIDRRKLEEGIEIARRVMGDRDTRKAFVSAFDEGRKVYGSVAGERAVNGLARLARDKRLQDDAGAFVRAVSGAVDAGVRAGRRRRRRAVLAWAALIGGAGLWFARMRARGAGDIDARPPQADAAVDTLRAGAPIG